MHPHPREPAPTQEVRDQNAGEVGLRVGPGFHVEVKHLVEPLLGRESPAKLALLKASSFHEEELHLTRWEWVAVS